MWTPLDRCLWSYVVFVPCCDLGKEECAFSGSMTTALRLQDML